ncbi:unnamed protein product, partial [Pocillopora meandrina]
KDLATPSEASSSQEGQQNRRLKVTLLSSEWRSSTDREVSTISRKLAIQLAKHPNVEVSVFLPKCSEEDKSNAASHKIQLIEADELPGHEPIFWLSSLPRNHDVDCVIGHGVHLGKQIPSIKRTTDCRWIQVVHSVHEEVGMYKNISEGEKLQQTELKLCKMADEVVAIGPKVAEAYKRFLCSAREEETILDLTPGVFSEFLNVAQATDERKTFCVLVIGSGDSCEDFNVKGFNMAAKAIAELKDASYQLKFLYSLREKGEEIAEKLLQHGISRNQLIVRSFNDNKEVLADMFCEVDLAIMPSRTEGFGLPGLEALSAGLPVLVSGNSGLGEALKEVPLGSQCVVDSEDSKDWAREIRDVRQKRRNVRLSEAKLLREHYAKAYDWEKPCTVLVKKMQTLAFGSSGSRLVKPVRDKRRTSFADTCQACKRPRKELTDGTYHKDHDLSVITKHLRAEYNRRSLLKPLLWENTFKLPLDDVYTKLSVVSRRITDFRLEDRTVNMFDIFKTVNKDDDSMVLVEGSPGIGKTTFCLKISHDWANQKIPSESAFPVFKLLLLLKCRDISGDIIDAIVDQLLPMEGKVKEKLLDYIKNVHNQENILVILDGLDELPEAGESHVKLLSRRMLPLCYVLATSRQEKGIEVRQKVDFDVLLQIEGFTQADSFEYIRKHFSHLGLDHVAKGERLIQSILENTFLHALPSNPLNLLLLCVVFEDYEGNLPSSRTELYHIIVCCLLRRYCAKNNVKAAVDDKALEEQFKDSLLALGQLAWRCLQNDRFSFREEELAEFERRKKHLAARKLGLVFKEASAKKINPQHEYHFFHKTFQEYLAALYLAHKLQEERVNVFHDLKLSFADITRKYNQVFIFVSGILGEATCNLFRQIGENLKVECWNWLNCSEQEATFFTECFSESGEAEQMAMTLCSFIPFPQSVTCRTENESCGGVLRVANACKNFLLLQLPIHLTLDVDILLMRFSSVSEFLTSYSRLETIAFFSDVFTDEIPDLVYNALQVNSSLHSFTLQTSRPFSPKEAAAIGDHLAANKTLQTVTLKLPGELGEHWATVLEKRLSGDTPLTSVVLEISGSVRKSSMVALNNLLRNRSLQSFGLTIYGDMHDLLATFVAEVLAADPYLKSLTLTVCGSISCSAFISLKKGVVENSTLRSLVLKVFGELPENWINICEALYVAKKSSLSLTIEPDVVSKITTSQVACLRPLLLEEKLGVLKLHSLTVKMWGELSCTGASDLCKLLIASRVSCVNLSIHGRVTDGVATCLVKNFDKVKSLSNLSINIRGEVTRDGESTLEALTCNQKFSCTLNVHDVRTVDEICEEVELSVVDSSSLTSAFTDVETICSRVSKVSMNFDSPIYSSEEDWGRSVGDFLAKFVSLTTLHLSFNNCSGMSVLLMGELGSSLAHNTSITTLSITVNSHSYTIGDWMGKLESSLAQNTSITTLSITVNSYSCLSGDWMGELGSSLTQSTSITTLISTVNNYSVMSGDWMGELGSSLAQNTSITTLSITVNNHSDMSVLWIYELGSVLAQNTSITTLSITVNSYNYTIVDWMGKLESSLAQNTSITTLSITVNSYSCLSGDWMGELGSSLTHSTSITTLSITFNNYSNTSGDWMDELGSGLAQNTSITTLSITVNNHSDMHGDWMRNLRSVVAQITSLAILNLTLNNHTNSYEDWINEF